MVLTDLAIELFLCCDQTNRNRRRTCLHTRIPFLSANHWEFYVCVGLATNANATEEKNTLLNLSKFNSRHESIDMSKQKLVIDFHLF